MRIIFATDVHGYFERVKILLEQAEADLYIIAGDLIDIPFYTMNTAMNYHELQTFFNSLRRRMNREDLYIEDFIDSLLDSTEITEEVRPRGRSTRNTRTGRDGSCARSTGFWRI